MLKLVNPIFGKTRIPESASHFIVVSSSENRGETSIRLKWLKYFEDEWRIYEVCEDGMNKYWWPVSREYRDHYINKMQPIEILLSFELVKAL